VSLGISVKKPNRLARPISFTVEEIEHARAGNFGPAEERVKKELRSAALAAPKKGGKALRKK